jgi:hypothetical protein
MFLALDGVDFNGALVFRRTLGEDECSEANLYVRAVNLAERGGEADARFHHEESYSPLALPGDRGSLNKGRKSRRGTECVS